MWNFQDLTGQCFGSLTVIKRADDYISPSGNKIVQWLCRCDCGNEKTVMGASLKRGRTRSCGCLQKELWHSRITKHGKHDSRLYHIWLGILTRCYTKNHHSYKHYGERGVAICDQWRNDFQAFYEWAMANGYNDELSIDRVDVNGDYSPHNCRWVSQTVQANNKRNNHYITHNGETKSMAEWAREYGTPYSVLCGRICKLKWSVEEALTKQFNRGKNYMTQKQRVLEHLKAGNEITSYEAMVRLGISDLPKRIGELRRDGHNIKSRTGHSVNEYGKTSYNIYKLEENDEQLEP